MLERVSVHIQGNQVHCLNVYNIHSVSFSERYLDTVHKMVLAKTVITPAFKF